jgi:hypothetical protein
MTLAPTNEAISREDQAGRNLLLRGKFVCHDPGGHLDTRTILLSLSVSFEESRRFSKIWMLIFVTFRYWCLEDNFVCKRHYSPDVYLF